MPETIRPAIAVGGLEGLANFLDDLMGGFALISFALSLGALLWSRWILAPVVPESQVKERLARYSLQWLYIGAFALAASHAVALIAKGWVLKETLGVLPWGAYLGTVQFKAGFIRMLLAFALGFAGRSLISHPHDPLRWRLIWGLMVAITVCGAWLTHGVGRFEARTLLMTMTVIHQVAGALWFGGVVQLIVFWRVLQKAPELKPYWPRVIRRFSTWGALAVFGLLTTGIPLAWHYIDSLTALIGTGYGSLLLTKIALMLGALGLAWLNHRAGRRWEQRGDDPALYRTIPHLIEAESFLLVSALFVAATLSSQPPATDIPQLTASAEEVWHMFSPKWPTLTSPSHEALLVGEAQRATIVGKEAPIAATEWSNFNHNVSGLFLTVMALTALAGYLFRWRWTRYWPAGFIALGVFLFFRSDAQAWPLGPLGFWESTFGDGEILQHRLATFLVLVLGGLETRARTSPKAAHLRYMFPILCAVGGILLLTHAHGGFELKTEYLIQSTHTVMGLLAIFMAAGRWLELKLEPPASTWAGIASMASMLLIGLLLMFYDEPLY
ncbi:copper resistance protein D [Methylomarinovum tepidoasis]|uniref:Copper resistance protein D n=1 Tax=Methylomarinovum tepidoasis TaxID=2840183 RepID=A0AAU9C6I1_9GAMM|nr:CopD family protein [Methylomarinovum sp. IN45]BCX89157.1 copper resistance protein D [Methylomarinovum sp. IN45]